MTLALFLGCAIFVFGPLVAIFLYIAKSSQTIILSMGSSFGWLIATLIASALWKAVKPLQQNFFFILPFAIILAELARFGLWKVYYLAYHRMEIFRNDKSKPTTLAAAIAMGWGMGATIALVMQFSMLFSALGPGDLPSPTCPSVSAFHVQALIILPLALLQITLSIILFDVYAQKFIPLIVFCIFLHFSASFASLVNQHLNCIVGIGLIWSVFAISIVTCWRLLASNKTTLVRRIS